MTVIDLELPLLLLYVGLACALVAWLLGTFTPYMRSRRYRVALGIAIFPLSGLMGFFCTLKLEVNLASGLTPPALSWLVGIAYGGYVLCGFLGCWTAVRIAGPLDRRHTLNALYSILEERKKHDMG